MVWVAIIAAVIATAVSVAASIQAGNAQARAARFQGRQQQAQNEAQARLLQREAEQANQNSLAEQYAFALEQESRQKAFARQFGARRAAIGASGVEFSGSPLLVAVDEAREAELALQAEEFGSRTRQREFADAASISTFQAQEFRNAGTLAIAISRARASQIQTEAALTATAQGISGVSSAAGAYYQGTGGGGR